MSSVLRPARGLFFKLDFWFRFFRSHHLIYSFFSVLCGRDVCCAAMRDVAILFYYPWDECGSKFNLSFSKKTFVRRVGVTTTVHVLFHPIRSSINLPLPSPPLPSPPINPTPRPPHQVNTQSWLHAPILVIFASPVIDKTLVDEL